MKDAAGAAGFSLGFIAQEERGIRRHAAFWPEYAAASPAPG
ncbi:hypothetical protein [Gluconacetobacter liquefaciens]